MISTIKTEDDDTMTKQPITPSEKRIYATVEQLLAEWPPPPPDSDWTFVDDLQKRAPRYLRRERLTARECEVDLSGGVCLKRAFPDPQGVLNTAYDDLDALLREGGLAAADDDNAYTVTVTAAPTDCYEAYAITIDACSAAITANDTEGIRRGIYAFEDMLLAADGPFLPCGNYQRQPWLKTRISRCFFSPVKRWPVNTDELLDDVNYYPDEYLNRLAHEGINGLWLVVALRELGETSFTDRDPKADRRIAKLHRTIRQCARYGIKVFLFCIEPFAAMAGDPLLAAHPELFGAIVGGRHLFCPSSPATRQYLRELTESVFRQAPDLGGLINITHGERGTTCLSALGGSVDAPIPCPRCGQRSHGDVIRDSLTAMTAGIHAAAPDATFISWFYFPHVNEHAPWAHTIGASVPTDVVAQFNYESGGAKTQLGRVRHGGDYWLSYVGPAERFARQAAAARQAGVEVSAKLQVGCSYELGTVPFIPAPGLIYRKLRAMRKHGVNHSMFCWYVGNYPGLMNHTGGRLAFEDFSVDEHEFLRRLAQPLWGAAAEAAAKAWELFSAAYENMPFSLMFQYYGPQNTGSVWQLSAYPRLRPLSPPWKPIFPPSGDALGEALAGFSLDDAMTLMRRVSDGWQEGLTYLRQGEAQARLNPERRHDLCLAEALGLHFENAVNLLSFYQLRQQLFTGGEEATLAKMRRLAERECALSLQLAELCEEDSRLGFHSEALCHRYYPKLLRRRSELIRTSVLPEIDALASAMQSGQTPWQAFLGLPEAPTVVAPGAWQPAAGGGYAWRFLLEDDDFVLEVKAEDGAGAGFLSVYMIDALGVTFPINLNLNWGKDGLAVRSDNYLHVLGYNAPHGAAGRYACSGGGAASLRWPLAMLPTAERRMRLNLRLNASFAQGNGYEHRLYLAGFSPEQTVLLQW